MGSGYNFKYRGRKGAPDHALFNKDLKQMMELSGGKGRERVPVRGDSKYKGPEVETCITNMFKEHQQRQLRLEGTRGINN